MNTRLSSCPIKHKTWSGPTDIPIKSPCFHRNDRKERNMFFLTTECLSMLIPQSGLPVGRQVFRSRGCIRMAIEAVVSAQPIG